MMAVTTSEDMRRRFSDWAATYGGEQLARSGYAVIENIGYALATPAANDDCEDAAEIERIVQTMEASGRWKEARVLRAQYFMPGLPEAIRLARLRRKGLPVSRTAYYVYLEVAHAFVAGALIARGSQRADRSSP